MCITVKWSEVAQSCPTLGDPMDRSLPDSSVHGIFQAVVLEWIAILFSRGSSRPRDRTQVSHIVYRRFTIWATRKVIYCYTYIHVYNSSYILKTDVWSLKYLMFTVTQFQASLSKFQESFVAVWIFSYWNGSPL